MIIIEICLSKANFTLHEVNITVCLMDLDYLFDCFRDESTFICRILKKSIYIKIGNEMLILNETLNANLYMMNFD
jgi:hypothetical protein